MIKKKPITVNRDFKGIWIPKEIWITKELTLLEKHFLMEIDSLDGKKGCYASNKHFSSFFGLSPSRCSAIISSLKEKDFIEIKYKYKGKQILKRTIRVFQKRKGGISETKGGYFGNAKGRYTDGDIQLHKKEVKEKKLSNGFNSSLKTKKINNKKTKKVKEYIKPKDFDMWWKLYPRKIQKGKAKTLWNKICNRQEKENTPTLKKIIRSVLKQSKTKQWLENKGKYIPHPSTWLNQMRWLDDSAKMKSWDNNYNSNKSGKVKPRYKGVGRSEIENIAAERDTLIWDDI